MSTDKKKIITVVIPNYNGMPYLSACLTSLLTGTFVPEIIVVDNHSTDGSREMVERDFPGVHLLALSANTGFCHAVNAGLHLVRTRYAILLNNDTRVDPKAVEALYTCIVQHGNAFSVQAKMLSLRDPEVIDDAGDLYCALGWAFARGKAKTKDHYAREGEIFSSCAGAAIYRMKVFDEIGWFDERHYCYLEDIDICYRARIYGYRNLYCPKAVVYHAGSASSGSVHNEFKEEMTAGNNWYLLYKNMPAFQYAVNAPLLHLGVAIKRRYFRRLGLGRSYESGLVRGIYLRQEADDMRWLLDNGYPYKKRPIPEEACLEDHDPALDEVTPLYLGGKVPFRLRHLPNYLRIQGELWGNTLKRLTN